MGLSWVKKGGLCAFRRPLRGSGRSCPALAGCDLPVIRRLIIGSSATGGPGFASARPDETVEISRAGRNPFLPAPTCIHWRRERVPADALNEKQKNERTNPISPNPNQAILVQRNFASVPCAVDLKPPSILPFESGRPGPAARGLRRKLIRDRYRYLSDSSAFFVFPDSRGQPFSTLSYQNVWQHCGTPDVVVNVYGGEIA